MTSETMPPPEGVPMPKPPITLVVDALQEVLQRNAIEVTNSLGADTRLFGRDGLLDSMGLVTLVVAVEQAVEEEYGISVSLADDRALSQRNSPYRTVGALAEYAAGLLDGTLARG
jgi:acyl carrier protein